MPIFEYTTVLASPMHQVFDFLVEPRNALLVAPPSPKVKFLAGPDRLELGSRFTVLMGKFGVCEMVCVVSAFEEGVSFTDTQETGPFAKWSHAHTLSPLGPGTTMLDRINYEAPSGWLGWILTNSLIMQELMKTFAYREGRFREVLGE